MFALLKRVFGLDKNEEIISDFKKIVTKINALENEISLLSSDEMKNRTFQIKEYVASGTSVDDFLHEAFALVKEASYRTLGMKHFDVQLIGGLALHSGMIAEMKTGEGKTLVAPLAAYVNALSGNGVHIVTVNDYLAKRDSEWMGKIFRELGLTVGCITSDLEGSKRKAQYYADITYATNNELGFDYLRDNMKYSFDEMVQRPFNFAIVDEVDSILIDESRTPLVISGSVEQNVAVYKYVYKIVSKLDSIDVEIDEKSRNTSLTDSGVNNVEKMLKEYGLIKHDSTLYDIDNMSILHCVDQSLKAHKLFNVNKDYILKDGKVVIIDEFTGRMMDGRRYSDGLHQALEAKENLKIQQESQTLASITFQNYFRMYPKLSGMTGTAITEKDEFANIYNLAVLQIPTNLPVRRKDLDDEIYATEDEKFRAIFKLIEECHKNDQPVLVGTISIEKSEKLSALLKTHKLKHSILNARYHQQEAHIIAQAGKPGAITIATNMAGRGTDIKLGGSIDLSSKDRIKASEDLQINMKKVIEAGGLYVIGTERHESRRIDNQLRGRAGRQGDIGSSKFFLSLDDDLLRVFGSEKISKVLKTIGLKENEAIHHSWITKALEKAQKKVENRNYEIRKSILKFDNIINDQRKVIFSHRNSIIADDVLDVVKIARKVNLSIFAMAKGSNTFYDNDILKSEMQRIYSIILSEDELNLDDIDLYLDSKVESKILSKESECDHSIMMSIKKRVMLVTLDNLWKEHLYFLDHLKMSVNLRAMGQKNPINEFKSEAFYSFDNMMSKWAELVIFRFLHLNIVL